MKVKITSVGHALFALGMVWLGAWGLAKGGFTVIWAPVPRWVPVQTALAYVVATISLAGGIGLLVRRTAAISARVLFVYLALWILAMRAPNLFYEKPVVLVAWSFGATAVMCAGAWLLAARFAGDKGSRIAQALYGVSLVPFGLAHFLYVDATTVLIPNWIPFHTFMAYATGATFVTAGLAVAIGILPRLAATLSTAQIGLFTVIVWIPRVLAHNYTEFQWGEFVATCVLTGGAWVVAESYQGRRWLETGRS